MFTTKRLYLKTVHEVSTEAVLAYYESNRSFLKAYEPLRPEAYYTFGYQDQMRAFDGALYDQEEALKLYIVKQGGDSSIIGVLNFSQIVMNAFCSCYLGYSLSEANEGFGYMTEALAKGLDLIFKTYKLHRVEGNVMPGNIKSIRLLERFSFVNEGLSKHYLKINGGWQDHLHYVLLNE